MSFLQAFWDIKLRGVEQSFWDTGSTNLVTDIWTFKALRIIKSHKEKTYSWFHPSMRDFMHNFTCVPNLHCISKSTTNNQQNSDYRSYFLCFIYDYWKCICVDSFPCISILKNGWIIGFCAIMKNRIKDEITHKSITPNGFYVKASSFSIFIKASPQWTGLIIYNTLEGLWGIYFTHGTNSDNNMPSFEN